MGKRTKPPACTHIEMDRIYGSHITCYVCKRSPSLGFLYQCRQDCDLDTVPDVVLTRHDSMEPTKSELRKELEAIGLSESVTLTAEAGHYSPEQLNKLKELKLELRQKILDAQQACPATDFMCKLAMIAKAPFEGAFGIASVKETVRHSSSLPLSTY